MSLAVEPILCNAGSMDNYAYLLTDVDTGICAIVDASENEAIINFCKKRKVTPKFILITHHHPDHTNAIPALKQKFGATVVGSEIEKNKIPLLDIALKDGDIFSLGNSKAQVILTAGHTKGHIVWYFSDDKALFTGDMLFNLCIGGLFEGTPQQMWQSIEKIKALPDDVCFFPGHEYTAPSIPYLLKYQDKPEFRQYLAFIEQKKEKSLPIVGVSLGLEKKCNPYFLPKSEQEFVDYFMD